MENIIPNGENVTKQLSMLVEFFHVLSNGFGVLPCSSIEEDLEAIHPNGTLLCAGLALEVFKHLQGIETFLVCLATGNAPWLLSKEAILLLGFYC